MAFFYHCSANSGHLYSRPIHADPPTDCPASGCNGRLRVISIKKTGAPRNYKSKAISFRENGAPKTVVAREFRAPNPSRDAASKGVSKRRGTDAKGLNLDKLIGVLATPDADGKALIDLDDREYIGETEPFKGVHSRLTASGAPYVDRANISAIVEAANTAKRVLRTPRAVVAQPAGRGGGQAAAMGHISAAAASARGLAAPQMESGAGAGAGAGAAAHAAHPAEEWCHLRASCLGGLSLRGNLVAASHACNTYMMVIETFLKHRTDLSLEVVAYCNDAACSVAEAIRYNVYNAAGVLAFTVLIDAVTPGFNRKDFDWLAAKLKRGLGTG